MKVVVFFKYFILILLSTILMAVFILERQSLNKNIINKFYGYEKLTLVSDIYIEELRGTQNGKLNYYSFSNQKETEVEAFLEEYQCLGIVFYFPLNLNIHYFTKKFNYNLTKVSNVGNVDVYYGYDSIYRDFIYNNGKKVNIQLVQNETGWVLGFPIILTGF